MNKYPVRVMANLLHSSSKAPALLKAYFDESGTHGGPVVAIAGYVANDTVWASVESRWQELLTNYGIESFHMTDFLAQRGEFHRMSTPIREDLITALVNVLVTADINAVWSGVDASSWESATTEQFRELFPKPYDLCFQKILHQLDVWSRHHAGGSRVGMVFAIQDEYNARSKEILSIWSRYVNCEQLGPIGFERAHKIPALQSADILVHEMCIAWKKYQSGNCSPGKISMSPILRDIWKGSAEIGGFLNANALKLYVNNKDWLNPSFPCPAAQPS